ncbi:MAG: glycoside hydrolase family 25 protein [Lactimicrobium massiliense]|nr:glycoside hydrolase family 25 protein [Lactimicrobium massiliense]MDD6726932.1 glycoside hydrolase family 25 protein [Lactimicrobium massiliense]
MKGIDVSKWQGSIDWNAVKAAGIEFAIIKAGGSDNGFYQDPCFEAYYNGAKAAGLHVGAYYFVGPACTSAADGAADAKRFMAQLAGKQFDFPVYIDFESPTAANPEGNTDACIAFCEMMESVGYYVGIYGSDYAAFMDKLEKKRLLPWTWWVAHYGAEVDYATENKGIWQYTSDGSVPGISGRVDMDEAYIDYSGTITAGGYNGYSKGSNASKPAAQPAPQPAAAPATGGFAVGDTVKPIQLVDYNGNRLASYHSTYQISELHGDRAVLTAGGQVWAALRTSNLSKVGGGSAPAPSSQINAGDRVRVTNAVTYNGQSFRTWYDTYEVMELKGDRAVIGVGGQVTAAINVRNITKA